MPDEIQKLMQEIQAAELEKLLKRKQALLQMINKLSEQINELELAVTTEPNAQTRTIYRQKIESLSSEITEKEREAEELTTQLLRIKAFDSLNFLRKSLFLFNYSDQIRDFHIFRNQLDKLAVLAIQGTPDCGLRLLLKRLLKLANKTADEKTISFDPNSGVSEKTIWYKVAEILGIGPFELQIAGSEEESLINLVTINLLKKLQTQSLLLKFDNIDAYGELDTVRSIIFKFWKEFTFKAGNLLTQVEHHLFLCLLHRQPPTVPFNPQVFLTPESPIDEDLFLKLNPIQPVQHIEFSDWILQKKQALDLEVEDVAKLAFKGKPTIFDYLSENITVPENGEYIKCLINRIGIACGDHQLYNNLLTL